MRREETQGVTVHNARGCPGHTEQIIWRPQPTARGYVTEDGGEVVRQETDAEFRAYLLDRRSKPITPAERLAALERKHRALTAYLVERLARGASLTECSALTWFELVNAHDAVADTDRPAASTPGGGA